MCCKKLFLLLICTTVLITTAHKGRNGAVYSVNPAISDTHMALTPQFLMPDFKSLYDDNSYDERDEFNQPIKKPVNRAAKRTGAAGIAMAKRTGAGNAGLDTNSLRALFIAGLHNLLLKSEIYSMARAVDVLKQRINPSETFFAVPFVLLIRHFIAGVTSDLKWLKRILSAAALCLLFSVIIVNSPLFVSFLFFTPKAKVAPLVLRC